ncbi:hypothetical protein [Streptomyces erythrochromogenes]|uniref:hypothetical protein n=1 Tax=Streptomyces erythrochromogenes TaxID=285574 RepID=UPI003862E81F|nr:hypothetical protein OG364_06860 [Streptomyces erythrochromogenes]
MRRSRLAHHEIRWGRMTPAGDWLGSRYQGHGAEARKPLPCVNQDADPEGELYGATVCLTGKLTSMTRDEAFAR